MYLIPSWCDSFYADISRNITVLLCFLIRFLIYFISLVEKQMRYLFAESLPFLWIMAGFW
ncbi:hypothetical protein BJK05_11335 [Pectobacterium polaris]|nr:hypothetical protein BJJ97_00030 [Pectobacterium polaris]ASY80549.1 hypothetical protein BJK05_11335 [Pectobacterium polaris]MCU1795225.1 hypothetical protein [Pectobacterium polaris]PWD55262.1 hypothetical protein DF209_20505 [Pectobacterium polaris]RJL23120.1 hypothetical protein D5074_11175 [Pectobacterium polaris]